MLGAGMLGVATDTGRSVIGTLLKPIGWLARMLGRAWVATENLLFNEERQGGIRNWVSDRMADVRIWAFGDDTKNGKMGVIPTVAVWAIKNVGQHFQYDSIAMKAARSLGAFLLAPRLLDLLAFVPVGPLYWPLRFIGSSAIAFAVIQPFLSLIGGVWDRIFPTVAEERRGRRRLPTRPWTRPSRSSRARSPRPSRRSRLRPRPTARPPRSRPRRSSPR